MGRRLGLPARDEDDEAAAACMAPASAPASSPEPKKMSPRAGPTIAEPVSWATIRRRESRAAATGGSVVSIQTGV